MTTNLQWRYDIVSQTTHHSIPRSLESWHSREEQPCDGSSLIPRLSPHTNKRWKEGESLVKLRQNNDTQTQKDSIYEGFILAVHGFWQVLICNKVILHEDHPSLTAQFKLWAVGLEGLGKGLGDHCSLLSPYNTKAAISTHHIQFIITWYRRTGFNCENLIIANCEFSRVCKLLIRKLIQLIAHPYVQFAQMQLLNLQCS